MEPKVSSSIREVLRCAHACHSSVRYKIQTRSLSGNSFWQVWFLLHPYIVRVPLPNQKAGGKIWWLRWCQTSRVICFPLTVNLEPVFDTTRMTSEEKSAVKRRLKSSLSEEPMINFHNISAKHTKCFCKACQRGSSQMARKCMTTTYFTLVKRERSWPPPVA